MKTKVTREFTLEMAHMLSNYVGKCNNLHGHSYKLQVAVIGPLATSGNSTGMVIDFGTLKTIVLEEVVQPMDHAILFSDGNHRDRAEESLLDWAKDYNKKYTVIPGRCTVENIATLIQQRVANRLVGYEVHVRMWETATSFVEVK